MVVLLLWYGLHRELHFLGQLARVGTLGSTSFDMPFFRDRFRVLVWVTNLHLQAQPFSIAELLLDLQVHLVESTHTMRELHLQAELRGSDIGQLDASDLHWAQLLEQPLVVVPRTLILWISEVSVLQLLKVRLDCLEWYDVRLVLVAQSVATVKARHELATIVPGREIGEIFLDQSQSHLAFCLNEHLLVLFVYLVRSFALQLPSLLVLAQERLDDPELVVPAVKVPLILL